MNNPKFSVGDHVMNIVSGEDFTVEYVRYSKNEHSKYKWTGRIMVYTGWLYGGDEDMHETRETNLVLFKPDKSLDVMDMIGINEPVCV